MLLVQVSFAIVAIFLYLLRAESDHSYYDPHTESQAAAEVVMERFRQNRVRIGIRCRQNNERSLNASESNA
jgi:uncharacterized membrane protein